MHCPCVGRRARQSASPPAAPRWQACTLGAHTSHARTRHRLLFLSSPHATIHTGYLRRDLLATGRPRRDAFLLLAIALEARAKRLGKLPPPTPDWFARNSEVLVGEAGALPVA